MKKMTVNLDAELYEQLSLEGADINVSALVRTAARAELERRKARRELLTEILAATPVAAWLRCSIDGERPNELLLDVSSRMRAAVENNGGRLDDGVWLPREHYTLLRELALAADAKV
jgi:post-segregation antitoxin (ccd killing protein)